ncbi:MAG TPA: restriction endonuclease [Oxalicibacterium sp.]|jgi:restriction system protein|nr:restriction endonuclease [Oxalicibacterium sp.]
MKLSLGKNSAFALLLRARWWVSVLIAAFVALLGYAVLPAPYKLLGAMTSMPFWIVGAIAAWRQFRAPSPAYVERRLQVFRALSWQQFSDGVEQALLRDSFVVTRLAQASADFSIVSGERKGLVTCRRWKAPTTGVEPLRELHQAVLAGDGQECIYLTTGSFTPNAIEFAAERKIRLVHGAALVQLLREIKTPLATTTQ